MVFQLIRCKYKRVFIFDLAKACFPALGNISSFASNSGSFIELFTFGVRPDVITVSLFVVFL